MTLVQFVLIASVSTLLWYHFLIIQQSSNSNSSAAIKIYYIKLSDLKIARSYRTEIELS